ncbi:anti-sigma factor antagonist [Mycolicibacterium sp. CH28]|uniref:STAS domain-containing protein n=1 Tax=Mycolicibacterium sp. CH28 TaxID=2512237 RepID=UPI0010817F2E|nr:STAS domain-containing protein [Mycolicibacterium sp. CH28]TGD88289.1 anti-sigma factor antagonist [Mycolicibacterium sp. CH28]
MTEAQFRFTAAPDGDSPCVVAVGDIDLANVAEFQDVMATAVGDAPSLTVDLAAVTYCDSAAVRALFAVAAATKLTMIVASAGPIRTLLGISGLDRVATVIAKE